jgi:hypothetical protein
MNGFRGLMVIGLCIGTSGWPEVLAGYRVVMSGECMDWHLATARDQSQASLSRKDTLDGCGDP